MPLYLNPQRKWTGKRLLQLAIAILALVCAIAVMIGWMLISHRQNNPPSDTSTNDSSQPTEPITTKNSSLVILDFTDNVRFMLVQSNAATQTVTTMAVPNTITDEDGTPLLTLLEKHGPMRVADTVSDMLELSVEHYVRWSAKGLQSFLEELHNGIVYAVPEDIQYIDENGISVRLSAGEQKLTGAQAAAVLQYTSWNNSTDRLNAAPQLFSAAINQYVTTTQSLDGLFAALADTAQTDLRIDNYNAFRPVLTHLAQANQGNLCQSISLIGAENNGRFIPDIAAMRQQTNLYS